MIYKHALIDEKRDFQFHINDKKFVEELLMVADIFEEISLGKKNALEDYKNYMQKTLSTMYANYSKSNYAMRHMLMKVQSEFQTKMESYLYLIGVSAQSIEGIELNIPSVRNIEYSERMQEVLDAYKSYILNIDYEKDKLIVLIDKSKEILESKLNQERAM